MHPVLSFGLAGAENIFFDVLRKPWGKAINSFLFIGSSWEEGFFGFGVDPPWIQKVNPASGKPLLDFLTEELSGFAQLLEAIASELADYFADFLAEQRIHFFQSGPAAHH
jgi:hypothetical protein